MMKLWHVIAAKIVITLLFWCFPLLLGSKALFEWIGVPFPEPEIFNRLLGSAYAGLLVAYWHGLLQARAGGLPISTVQVGIVSNGIASIVLGRFGLSGAWATWSPSAQIYMWLSLAATVLITLGLVTTGWIQTKTLLP
jgi:hypothetical protein